MSDPSEILNILVAKATAAPPDEPPQVLDRSYGFLVFPYTGLKVLLPNPNSGVFVFPINSAPAARNLATI